MAVSRCEDKGQSVMPEALRQRPPEDRFCDLVLTGGVASGVVYPWALVELARHYRFRRIGGNSVGAMAAVLAAAAEYGRCTGQDGAFEVLRQSPVDLAEAAPDGRTRMERLFQPAPGVKRLFDCAIKGIRHANDEDVGAETWLKTVLTVRDVLDNYHLFVFWLLGALAAALPTLFHVSRLAFGVGVAFAFLFLLCLRFEPREVPRKRARFLVAVAGVLAAAHCVAVLTLVISLWPSHGLGSLAWGAYAFLLQVLGILGWTVAVVLAFAVLLIPELRAFKENGYGLCPGKAQADGHGNLKEKALVEWLHEGVQRSIGREKEDAPLTFAELWSAPRKVPLAPGEESISLEMFSTNLTLGRPLVWPLRDPNLRLFYRYRDWQRFFPPTVLDALWRASDPYRPLTDGDPAVQVGVDEYRELPAGGMPIVVAARLSLSFPVLFSCIPVYAVDYAGRRGQRVLRQCQLTDGGICTNFPIHLFDAAHPKWPTFGLLLSRRLGQYKGESLWLPERPDEGRADSWSRDVPGASDAVPGPLAGMAALFGALFGTALRWNDNLLTRLPHVRNRVLRINLLPGEGELHITMPPKTIMKMASVYGTAGGRMLARRFVSDNGVPTVAWQEHLYVRTMNELRAVTTHLRGYADAVEARGYNKPVKDILKDAIREKPTRSRDGWPRDPLGDKLSPAQAAALQEAVDAIAALARTLEAKQAELGPYEPIPTTRFHLRSQI